MRMTSIAFAALVAATPALAQRTPPPQNQDSAQVLKDMAGVVFQEAEKRIIKEYYDRMPETKMGDARDDDSNGRPNKHKDKHKKAKSHGRGNGLPPGLAKRDQLPPGLAKRGNHLPPGLMKSDLPPDLERELPPLRKGVERVIVDNDVLLVQKGTDLILDVLKGVLNNQ